MPRQRCSMSFRRSFVLAAALLIGACAAKQHVTLDCLPEDVTIFVDGRRLESNPDSVELESDKPHTVLFRAPGYKPRMVVIESDPASDGPPLLRPARVCADLLARTPRMQRHLDLEVDDQPPAKPGGSP